MHQLDELDMTILAELERNARIKVSNLARHLNIPTSTTRDRIHKLEEVGVIRGYTTLIDHTKLGLNIKAIIQASREHRVTLNNYHSESAKLPEVTNMKVLTGDVDQLITIYARDVDDLRRIIYSTFQDVKGMVKLSTSIVLSEQSFPLTRRFSPDQKKGSE